VSALLAGARPRLARGVRLRQDRLTGKYLLLRPERGFELRGSALEVVRLCDAASTVTEIIDRLASVHGETPRAQVAGDVTRLLDELIERGLIAVDEAVTGPASGSASGPASGDGA
jgi:pyrroloquinoline quinone biosynthesis protein D